MILIEITKLHADLVQAISELAQLKHGMTDAARLRAIYDQVEPVLQSGFKIKEVVSMFNERGFSFSVSNFKVALGNIRKEKKLSKGAEK